jgi:hypothetical protein
VTPPTLPRPAIAGAASADTARSGGPSELVALGDDAVWEVDAAWGAVAALRMLADEAGGAGVAPGVNCGGVFSAPGRPPMPPEGAPRPAAGGTRGRGVSLIGVLLGVLSTLLG